MANYSTPPLASSQERMPGPLPRGTPGRPWSDEGIKAILRDSLRKECGIDGTYCEMEVRDQVVYLRGSVGNLAQKRVASTAALAVAGVRAVVNELRIAPLCPRNDGDVAREVQEALSQDLQGHPTFKVEVRDGLVYLSGSVTSLEELYAAEDIAWSVRGVREVVNNVITTAVCPRPDEDLLRDIQLRLSRCLNLGPGKIDLEVKDGVAYLRGQVDSESEKFMAEDAVRWTPCIADVVNSLTVRSEGN